MKNALISGIILLILGGIISKFIFNDKTELRYVLSDRIPTNFFEGNESESIQQLELLNTGDLEINRVIIKIKSNIKEYKVQKIANSDSINITQNTGFLEIVYPQIPPEGNIKIIIKSVGDGLNSGDIDIKHSKGSAKPALEENKTTSYVNLGLMILYFIIIAFNIRNSLIDSVAYKIYYNPYENILDKSKPWYIPTTKWKKIRDDSLKFVFDYANNSTNIANTLYYQILNSDKSKNLDDDEWLKLKIISQNKLLKSISENINSGYSWKIDEFLKLKQPKNIDEDTWENIISLISKAYSTTFIMKVSNYIDSEGINKLQKIPKPQIVDEKEWEKYQSFLTRLKDLNDLKIQNETIQHQLKLLIYGDELKEKPDELSSETWEKIKKIEIEIFNKSEQIREDLLEIENIKTSLLPLKIKLEKQLEIINEVLTDPTAIDRIEDYANPFSSGNFENLKKISKLNNKITKA